MATKTKKYVLPWERFKPIAYQLNFAALLKLPLTVRDESGSRDTTVGALVRELVSRTDEGVVHVPEVEEGYGVTIKTPKGEMHVESLGSARFPAQMLCRTLQLDRLTDGYATGAALCYYDCDQGHVDSTWWEHFRFFVVVGDRVVETNWELSSLCEDDIDDSVLEPTEFCTEEASRKPGWDTLLRWWYGKFYTKTRTGRLMAMRAGSRVFHFVPRARREQAADARLLRIEILLIIVTSVLVLGGIWRALFR